MYNDLYVIAMYTVISDSELGLTLHGSK